MEGVGGGGGEHRNTLHCDFSRVGSFPVAHISACGIIALSPHLPQSWQRADMVRPFSSVWSQADLYFHFILFYFIGGGRRVYLFRNKFFPSENMHRAFPSL